MTSDYSGPSTHCSVNDVLARIAETLLDAAIPHIVVDAAAVVMHGEPCLNLDLDWTLAIPPFEAPRVVERLDQMRLAPLVDNALGFVGESHVLPCSAHHCALRIDFSFTDSVYIKQAVARGVDKIIHGIPVRFVSVEDLLIHKLLAGRARDIDDAKSVILKNPGFDRDEVRRWLARFAEVIEGSFVEQFEALLRECDQRP